MNILTKSVPQFDPQNVNGSLQAVYNYLSAIMREIDFKLTTYSGQLGKSSLPETTKEVSTIKGQMAAISSVLAGIASKLDVLEQNQEDDLQTITELQGAVNGLAARADEMGTSINEVRTGLEEVKGTLADLQSAIDDVTTRVTQLEQQGGI